MMVKLKKYLFFSSIILFIISHPDILILWFEIITVTEFIVIHKNSFHDIRDLIFLWLKEYYQILHRTVACADIHLSYFAADSLLHIIKRLFNFLYICLLLRHRIHSHHDQIAVMLMPLSYIFHELIDPCKLPVI